MALICHANVQHWTATGHEMTVIVSLRKVPSLSAHRLLIHRGPQILGIGVYEIFLYHMLVTMRRIIGLLF